MKTKTDFRSQQEHLRHYRLLQTSFIHLLLCFHTPPSALMDCHLSSYFGNQWNNCVTCSGIQKSTTEFQYLFVL